MSDPAPPRRVAVACDHPGCRLPVAYVRIRDGVLVLEITTRHRGEWHTTRVRIDDVQAQIGDPFAGTT